MFECMKTSDEILLQIINIVERWGMGRENDNNAMDKIALILRDNHRLKVTYHDIINTSTKV